MINPDLIDFLKELAQNNEREWFQENKEDYQTLREEFSGFLRYLAEEIATFDPVIEARLGDPRLLKVFRIYRDVRFAKDKAPYKTNMSGTIGGDEEGSPVYYLSVEPGQHMVGGGLYMPGSSLLKRLREKIDEEHKDLRKILKRKAFKQHFPEGLDTYAMLKTAPRGYSVEHPAIDLLRYKSFTASYHPTDDELLSEDFAGEVLDRFEALAPLLDFLRVV